jgi:protein SCO1/2
MALKNNHLLLLLGFFCLSALFYFLNTGKERYQRNIAEYQIPEVILFNQDAQPVPLQKFLNSNKPVMLEFIFTSCTTLCPNQSAKFANFQKRLAPDTEQVRLVSITVDPEIDTPAVIHDYLEQYQAQPGWDFLTGSKYDIEQVMTAFDIKPTDMITLDSSLLLRSAKAGRWVRIDGPLDKQDFMTEYLRLKK